MEATKTYTAGSAELKALRRRLEGEQRSLRIHAFLKNRASVVGLALVVLLVLVALAAPLLTGLSGTDPYTNAVSQRLQPPGPGHWFGTDDVGRDVFARVIYGTRISLFVGFSVSVLAGAMGLLIGLYSCYNKVLDAVLMRICDGLKAIPSTLLAICLMAVLGPSVRNVIISLMVVSTPSLARMVRSSALAAREQTYVEAMVCLGASPTRILWKHIMPNTLSPVIVQMTFVFASAILSEAALSFLGAGVPVPEPSWGSILSQGRTYVYTAWWLILYPGVFTALAVLGFNLFGDGVRDLLDPMSH